MHKLLNMFQHEEDRDRWISELSDCIEGKSKTLTIKNGSGTKAFSIAGVNIKATVNPNKTKNKNKVKKRIIESTDKPKIEVNKPIFGRNDQPKSNKLKDMSKNELFELRKKLQSSKKSVRRDKRLATLNRILGNK